MLDQPEAMRLIKVFVVIALLCHGRPGFVQAQDSMAMGGTKGMSGANMAGAGTRMAAALAALNGSGTDWQPRSSPMYGIMTGAGPWQLMSHGSAYVRYTWQNVDNSHRRDGRQFDGPNWLMGAGDRKIGGEYEILVRAMFSLDPLTEGGAGYPLLFQTGESFNGLPLIDRQHPHDLFMELSATGFKWIGDKSALFVYFGMPGEPAIGPTAFMHRPSCEMDPDAPLGHHWQDATHITFGVATAGVILDDFKIDGSVFNGREPDQNRYDFDRPRFNSFALRLSDRVGESVANQFSAAFLRSPELLHPDEDIVRLTGSSAVNFPVSAGIGVAVTLIYGGNLYLDPGGSDWGNSVLIEAEAFLNRLILYGREETVQKPGGELDLPGIGKLWVNAVTLGGAWRVIDILGLDLFAGAQGTIDAPQHGSYPEYGSVPVSFEVYARVRPRLMGSRK